MKDGNLESFEALLDDNFAWGGVHEEEATATATGVVAGVVTLSQLREQREISLEKRRSHEDFYLYTVSRVGIHESVGSCGLDLTAFPKVCACTECGLPPVFSLESRVANDVLTHYASVRCGRSGDHACPPPLSSGVMVACKTENTQYAFIQLIKGWNALCFGHVFVPQELVCL